MKNEQDQIKINDYDINMLIGIYFYDQGTIQLSKLAEMVDIPENEVDKILAEYRESPVYKDFYAEMSSFSNLKLGKQDTEVLSKCMDEAAELMHAFYVLEERKVSPVTILNEGHADKLLQSAYFREMIGQTLSGLVQNENSDLPGWKRLMAETALIQDYSETIQAMKTYAGYRRRLSSRHETQDADYREMVAKAYARAKSSATNYSHVFSRPFVLPEVDNMTKLYDSGKEDLLVERIRDKKSDVLVIGQFAEYLSGSSNELKTGFLPAQHLITDRLAEALSQTAWFGQMVGYDLSGVCPEMMTHSQFELACNYAVRLTQNAGDSAVVELRGFDGNGDEMNHQVNCKEVYDRMNILFDIRNERQALEAMTEEFMSGKSAVNVDDFINSPRFRMQYGEDLSLFSTSLEPTDVMIMELYRKSLESRANAFAIQLAAVDPSLEKLDDYRNYVTLTNLIDSVSDRMEQLYPDLSNQMYVLTPQMNLEQTPDKAIMLLYDKSKGSFVGVDAGTKFVESPSGLSVIDRYTTIKHALDFIRLADQKIERTKSGVLSTDSMRNEYKVFSALPAGQQSHYLSMDILSAEMATKSEHPDLSALRAFAYEYEQRVAFDLANAGVVDVVQTDQNRAEYQQKMEMDSGLGREEKTGNKRSV